MNLDSHLAKLQPGLAAALKAVEHLRVIINLDKFDARMGAKILRRIPSVKR